MLLFITSHRLSGMSRRELAGAVMMTLMMMRRRRRMKEEERWREVERYWTKVSTWVLE